MSKLREEREGEAREVSPYSLLCKNDSPFQNFHLKITIYPPTGNEFASQMLVFVWWLSELCGFWTFKQKIRKCKSSLREDMSETNVPDKESFTLHFGCKFILYLICWALEEHWIEWRYLSYIEPKVLISKLFELSFLITFTPSTLSILIHLFHFSLSLSLLQFFACWIVAYRNAILVVICTI